MNIKKLFSKRELTKDLILKCGFKKISGDNIDIKRGIDVYELNHDGTQFRLKINNKYPKSNPNCGFIGKYIPKQEIPAPTDENLDNIYYQEEVTEYFVWGIKYYKHLKRLTKALTE